MPGAPATPVNTLARTSQRLERVIRYQQRVRLNKAFMKVLSVNCQWHGKMRYVYEAPARCTISRLTNSIISVPKVVHRRSSSQNIENVVI